MRPGKILVVDDDPEVRMATRDFLSSKGYDVSVAEGGRDALRQLDSSPADVVIMVTGNADIEITSKVLQLGAADYVPKPFDLDYLNQAIRIQLSPGRGN